MINSPRQQGVTLIELIATILILSIALFSIAVMLNRGLRDSSNILLETQATALGYAYLDEIMGRSFDEEADRNGLDPCFGLLADPGPPLKPCTAEVNFGPDSGENRRDKYDDVDDYHGLAEGAGQPDPLQDADGNARSGYDSFSVTVDVRYAGDDAVLGRTETHAKFIVVSVLFASESLSWDFAVYKGNY